MKLRVSAVGFRVMILAISMASSATAAAQSQSFKFEIPSFVSYLMGGSFEE